MGYAIVGGEEVQNFPFKQVLHDGCEGFGAEDDGDEPNAGEEFPLGYAGECKSYTRVGDDEDDAELEARVKAAQEKIDAKNQVKGKVLIAKSALTMDVKPWEVRQHY